FVVVDGRQPSSAGLTMAKAAELLAGLGATEAANLDGGGGSTFVVGGTVWNQPSDAPTQDPARAERVASNAFVILPRPGGPPAPKLPPRPATGTGSGSGSSTPAAGGGSTGPDPSPGPAGSAPFLGPRAARPINPAAPGEPLLGGLFSLPGAGSPITGLPGLWNTASTSGGGRVLGLLATTEVAPVGFAPADG